MKSFVNTRRGYAKETGRKPLITPKQIDALVREHLLALTVAANRQPREKRKWGSMHSICCVEMRAVAKALGISWRKVDASMTRLADRKGAVIDKIGPYYSLALVKSWKPRKPDWDSIPDPPEKIGFACFIWDEEVVPKKKRYSKRLQRRVG